MSDQLENWTEEAADHGAQKGKGRKGGKKGGKGGKKGGKKGYDGPRRPRRFQVDQELEKEERSVEELKASMAKVEGDVSSLKEKVSKLKDQKKQQNDEEREAQFASIREEIEGKKAEKKVIDATLQKIQQDISVYQVKVDDIYAEKKAFLAEKARRKKENGVNYTEEDVAEAIRKVEEKHETCGGLSSRSERNFMTQLRKLEQVKATLKELRKYDVAAAEKEKIAKEVKDQMKPHLDERDAEKEKMKIISTEISKLNKKIDSMKGGNQPEIDSAERQMEKLGKQVRALRRKVNYKEDKVKHEEDVTKFAEDEKKWKEEQEKKKAEEEEYRKRNDEDYRFRKEKEKERDEERAAINKEIQEIKRQDPWRDEQMLCENLIVYCEKLIGKTSESKQVKKELSEKEKMEEAMKKLAEKAGGGMVLKGKSDDFLLHMKKPKAKPVQKVETATKKPLPGKAAPVSELREKPTTVSHSFAKFGSFDALKVDTPMTVAEVTKCIGLLQKRKEWLAAAEIGASFEDWRTAPPKKEREQQPKERSGKGGPRKGGKGSKGGKSGKGKKAGDKAE